MHTKFLPELRARGLHATFGINKGQVGTNDGLYVNEAKLHEIYAAGNDVGNHNVTNTALGTYTVAQYLAEYDECTAWLRSRGWRRGAQYHPLVQGKHSQAVLDGLAARGASVIRCALDSAPMLREQLYFGGAVFLKKRTSLDNTVTLAQAKAHIDDAITYSHDVALMGHILAGAAGSATWAQTDYAALLDYAIAKVHVGVLEGVGSVSEWAAIRGIDFGVGS
jgi:hypothetical protein